MFVDQERKLYQRSYSLRRDDYAAKPLYRRQPGSGGETRVRRRRSERGPLAVRHRGGRPDDRVCSRRDIDLWEYDRAFARRPVPVVTASALEHPARSQRSRCYPARHDANGLLPGVAIRPLSLAPRSFWFLSSPRQFALPDVRSHLLRRPWWTPFTERQPSPGSAHVPVSATGRSCYLASVSKLALTSRRSAVTRVASTFSSCCASSTPATKPNV